MRFLFVLCALLFLLPTLYADEIEESKSEKSQIDETDLDAVEEALSARLTEQGLEGRDHSWVLQEELKIQKRVVKIEDPEERKSENHRLHVEKAEKLISAYDFRDYIEKYRRDCEERWEEWWFNTKPERIVKLQAMFDELEKAEIDARKEKGAKLKTEVFETMARIAAKRKQNPNEAAIKIAENAWDTLAETPLRLYKKARFIWVTEVKRMGFHAEAIAHFEKSIDSLFEEEK